MRDVKKVQYMLAAGSLNRVYLNNDNVLKRIIKSTVNYFKIKKGGIV